MKILHPGSVRIPVYNHKRSDSGKVIKKIRIGFKSLYWSAKDLARAKGITRFYEYEPGRKYPEDAEHIKASKRDLEIMFPEELGEYAFQEEFDPTDDL